MVNLKQSIHYELRATLIKGFNVSNLLQCNAIAKNYILFSKYEAAAMILTEGLNYYQSMQVYTLFFF